LATVRERKSFFEPKFRETANRNIRHFEWYYLWNLCHQAVASFNDGGAINAATFFTDGAFIASGGGASTVYIRQLEKMAQLTRCPFMLVQYGRLIIRRMAR